MVAGVLSKYAPAGDPNEWRSCPFPPLVKAHALLPLEGGAPYRCCRSARRLRSPGWRFVASATSAGRHHRLIAVEPRADSSPIDGQPGLLGERKYPVKD